MSAQAEIFSESVGNKERRNADKKPSYCKTRTYLPQDVKRPVGIVPDIPAETSVNYHSYGKFNCGYHKGTDKAATEQSEVGSGTDIIKYNHYQSTRYRHCPMGITPYYNFNKSVYNSSKSKTH